MKKEKKRFVSKKWLRSVINRLAVATVAVGIAAVLILWDTGVIDLPGLSRRDRRETETVTEEGNSTVTEKPAPVPLGAAAFLSSLYEKDAVANVSQRVTALSFQSSYMSLVKKALPETDGSYDYYNGLLIHKKNGVITSLRIAATNEEVRFDTEFTATLYRDDEGNAVFQTKDGSYFIWDSKEKALVPSDFTLNRLSVLSAYGLPTGFAQKDQRDTEMLEENGLFGYTGKFKDRWYTRSFTVEPQYPVAFPYREGYAVMADANGNVTIRNDKGEACFTQYHLLLPEESGTVEDLGYYFFDGGLLRVVLANDDEEGNVLSRKSAILCADGSLFQLPDGFRAVSYMDGVLTITDGSFYGFYTCHSAWISNPVYRSVSPFMEGLAVVQNENELYGVIDLQGKTVVPCAFESISACYDGSFLVHEKKAGWFLLSKVDGIFLPNRGEVTPDATEAHSKVTVSRGPNNTQNTKEPIVVTLAPITSTPSYTTHPPVDR